MKNADMPAMPSGINEDYNNIAQEPLNLGLTKREYFAAMAMQGMLAHSTRYKTRDQDSHLHWHEGLSKEARDIADTLLAELERTP